MNANTNASTSANVVIIQLNSCAEWIQTNRAEYVRTGWDTWEFYNRREAGLLLALWAERGYTVVPW